jgi:hypothetical protein
MTLKEILLLAASVGFFIIWGLELYNGIPLKASYFWVMFGLASMFYFQYSKNERLKKEKNKASIIDKTEPKVKKTKTK